MFKKLIAWLGFAPKQKTLEFVVSAAALCRFVIRKEIEGEEALAISNQVVGKQYIVSTASWDPITHMLVIEMDSIDTIFKFLEMPDEDESRKKKEETWVVDPWAQTEDGPI